MSLNQASVFLKLLDCWKKGVFCWKFVITALCVTVTSNFIKYIREDFVLSPIIFQEKKKSTKHGENSLNGCILNKIIWTSKV